MLGLAVALMIFASIFWIEAHKQRAVIGVVQSSSFVQTGFKLLGWLMAVLALVLIASGVGWERGIPIALAWLMGAGVLSLLFAARYKGQHWKLAWPALGIAAFAGAAVVFGGAG